MKETQKYPVTYTEQGMCAIDKETKILSGNWITDGSQIWQYETMARKPIAIGTIIATIHPFTLPNTPCLIPKEDEAERFAEQHINRVNKIRVQQGGGILTGDAALNLLAGCVAGYKAAKAKAKEFSEAQINKAVEMAYQAGQKNKQIFLSDILQSLTPKLESVEIEFEEYGEAMSLGKFKGERIKIHKTENGVQYSEAVFNYNK